MTLAEDITQRICRNHYYCFILLLLVCSLRCSGTWLWLLPCAGTLDVVLWLALQRRVQRLDALGRDHRQCQGLAECGDVTQCHDSWQGVVAFRFEDVVHQGTNTTYVAQPWM